MVILLLPSQSNDKLAEESQEEAEELIEEEEDPDLVAAQGLADFPIEVNLRIYINKTIVKSRLATVRTGPDRSLF